MARAAGNMDLIRRATVAWNDQDLERWIATYSDPCLYHFGRREEMLTRDEHVARAKGIFKVFPDFFATIEALMAEGDRVYVRWSYVGTHLGKSDSGVEPTGKRVDFGTVLAEHRVDKGQVVEVWELSDLLRLDEIADL